ncbi:neurogenic differentiation factor 4-like [Macrosteles quadrilineatus]|uniref:neurogenic differentiation factor 4-like n=1 Tax=Macrosteles quadrilineatus TaxID=74068 RepID=UPI0023E2DB74|nr:neurogenic differentiation factor 4-like [Macrosteles quadrilineatus]
MEVCKDGMDEIDPNNNTEKSYSLRPRASLKKEDEDSDHEDSWRPRGRSKKRSKQKSLPLSKYRRKTANARERSRMREINDAFEALRRVLPHCNTRSENPNEKTTKIMTLRLAMKYIAALDNALRQAEFDSDGESLISDYGIAAQSREHSLTPSSTSEHSDIFDQLFISSSFDDHSSTSSRCDLSPLLRETLNSPSRSSPSLLKFDLSAYSKSIATSRLAATSAVDSRTTKAVLPPYTTLTSAATTEFPPQVKDSSPVEVQEYPDISWREFDCLSPSPVNLDDLFIT